MRYALLLPATALLTACATVNYGRVPSLSDAERTAYTCHEIDIELVKAQSFVDGVVAQAKGVSGKDVLGFLGDFGIGNSLEYDEAIASGTQRVIDLKELQRVKGCPVLVVPETA